MSAQVGKSIVVAIMWPTVKGEQPTIDAYRGVVERTAKGGYAVAKPRNKSIDLLPEWILKIKPMTADLVEVFGKVDLILVVSQGEFAAAGYDYDVSSTGDMVFKVKK